MCARSPVTGQMSCGKAGSSDGCVLFLFALLPSLAFTTLNINPNMIILLFCTNSSYLIVLYVKIVNVLLFIFDQ